MNESFQLFLVIFGALVVGAAFTCFLSVIWKDTKDLQ